MVIDIWQIGIFYRVMQVLIFMYVIWDFVSNQGWAFQETPMGATNIYISEANSRAIIAEALETSSNINSSFEYCGNSNYAYEYSTEYPYGAADGGPPECRSLAAGEVGEKGLDYFFFTTSYDERHFKVRQIGLGLCSG